MPDVFISHSSKDKAAANNAVRYLESRGLTCWIAPRDIIPGTDWAASISTAINSSKCFLVMYSANCAASEQCARELAIAETKKGLLVVPYRIDSYDLIGSFEYYLIGSHWVVADPDNIDAGLGELCGIITAASGENAEKRTERVTHNPGVTTNIYVPPPEDAVPVIQTSGKSKSAELTQVCSGCGAVIPANAKFCNKCGKRTSLNNEPEISAHNISQIPGTPVFPQGGFGYYPPHTAESSRSRKKYRFTIENGRWSCEYCGKWNSFRHSFCRSCGELRDEEIVLPGCVIYNDRWLCKNCGTMNKMPESVCRKCGAGIGVSEKNA